MDGAKRQVILVYCTEERADHGGECAWPPPVLDPKSAYSSAIPKVLSSLLVLYRVRHGRIQKEGCEAPSVPWWFRSFIWLMVIENVSRTMEGMSGRSCRTWQQMVASSISCTVHGTLDHLQLPFNSSWRWCCVPRYITEHLLLINMVRSTMHPTCAVSNSQLIRNLLTLSSVESYFQRHRFIMCVCEYN